MLVDDIRAVDPRMRYVLTWLFLVSPTIDWYAVTGKRATQRQRKRNTKMDRSRLKGRGIEPKVNLLPEVAELRRVQKQKERLEKLNKQVQEERAELERQLEESKKHGEYLR